VRVCGCLPVAQCDNPSTVKMARLCNSIQVAQSLPNQRYNVVARVNAVDGIQWTCRYRFEQSVKSNEVQVLREARNSKNPKLALVAVQASTVSTFLPHFISTSHQQPSPRRNPLQKSHSSTKSPPYRLPYIPRSLTYSVTSNTPKSRNRSVDTWRST
jgi:hypothetical protein